ncbi:MAG: hypothetical protein PHD43_16405 [Methylococcales bacterium]|nr:hypothetical protein [Methylococcales bacterium]
MLRQQRPLPFQQIGGKEITATSHKILPVIGHNNSTTIKTSIAEGRSNSRHDCMDAGGRATQEQLPSKPPCPKYHPIGQKLTSPK